VRSLAFGAGMLVASVAFGQETWLDCKSSYHDGLELKVGFDQEGRWVEIRETSYVLQAREFRVTPGWVFGDTGMSTMNIDRVSGKFTHTRFTKKPGASSRSPHQATEGECVLARNPPAAGKF